MPLHAHPATLWCTIIAPANTNPPHLSPLIAHTYPNMHCNAGPTHACTVHVSTLLLPTGAALPSASPPAAAGQYPLLTTFPFSFRADKLAASQNLGGWLYNCKNGNVVNKATGNAWAEQEPLAKGQRVGIRIDPMLAGACLCTAHVLAR